MIVDRENCLPLFFRKEETVVQHWADETKGGETNFRDRKNHVTKVRFTAW